MSQARGTKVRYTRPATAVVAAMSGMATFCGAREICAAVRRDVGRVGVATVYRHLRVLAEQGCVDSIRGADGKTLYRLRRDSFVHHLTCRACGCSAEIDGREVWEWGQRVAAHAGFTLTGYTVEISGLCAAHGES